MKAGQGSGDISDEAGKVIATAAQHGRGPVSSGFANTAETNVVVSATDGMVPAEQVALLKALSEGDKEFLMLVMVNDLDATYCLPSAASARMLHAYGDFPVYAVRRDRTFAKHMINEIARVQKHADDELTAGGSEQLTYSAIHKDTPVSRWTVPHVSTWLDSCVSLPQYQHKFRESSVDGMKHNHCTPTKSPHN